MATAKGVVITPNGDTKGGAAAVEAIPTEVRTPIRVLIILKVIMQLVILIRQRNCQSKGHLHRFEGEKMT